MVTSEQHYARSVVLYERSLREGIADEQTVQRLMRDEARRWADVPGLAQAFWARLKELEASK